MQNIFPAIPRVRSCHYNTLPTSTRRRLIDSIAWRGAPSPLLDDRLGIVVPFLCYGVLFLISIAVVVAIYYHDFDSMNDWYQGLHFLGAYVLGIFVALYSMLLLVERSILRRRLPFEPGRYIFPTDLLVATSAHLEVYPLAELLSVSIVHHRRNGMEWYSEMNFQFEGGVTHTFKISFKGEHVSEMILHKINAARERLGQAIREQDWGVVQAADVFYDVRAEPMCNDPQTASIATTSLDGPLARDMPGYFKWSLLLAFVPAVALSLPLWLTRNLRADELAYQTLKEHVDGWSRGGPDQSPMARADAYMKHGSHQSEVRSQLIPRIIFAEAQRAGTVTALRNFVRDNPNSRYAVEAGALIRERFEQARLKFLTQANDEDASMLGFVTNLLRWQEQHDSPTVHVRFNAPSAESLTRADQGLNTSFPQRQGRSIAPLSPDFTPEASRPHESSVTSALQRGFAAILPDDVMRLEHRDRIAMPDQPLDPGHAGIDVSYSVRPSGPIYMSSAKQRTFVGLHLDFNVSMHIPDSPTSYSFNLSVEPPEDSTVSQWIAADTSHGDIYGAISQRAFERLSARMAEVFFRVGTKAYQRAVADVQPKQQLQR
jgi:hypothetical protein